MTVPRTLSRPRTKSPRPLHEVLGFFYESEEDVSLVSLAHEYELMLGVVWKGTKTDVYEEY